MKQNILNKIRFIFPVILLLFSACALFLGPLTDISLQQRLKNGWTKSDWYTIQTSFLTNMNDFKLQLFWCNGKMNSIFGGTTNSPTINSIYINMADESNNQVIFSNANGGANMTLSNVFDCYYDEKNYSVIFTWSGYVSNYINGAIRNNTILASLNTAYMVDSENFFDYYIGASSMVNLGNFSGSNSNIYTGAMMDQIRIGKVSGSYQGKTIGWYGLYTNSMPQERITFFDALSGAVNTINPAKVNVNEPVQIACLNNNFYLLKKNNIMKYDNSSGSFSNVVNYFLQQNFNGLTISGDSIYFSSLSPVNASSESLSIYQFSSANNKILQNQIDIPVNTIASDLYYDTNTQALYLGLVDYDGQKLHLQVWKNQLN